MTIRDYHCVFEFVKETNALPEYWIYSITTFVEDAVMWRLMKLC